MFNSEFLNMSLILSQVRSTCSAIMVILWSNLFVHWKALCWMLYLHILSMIETQLVLMQIFIKCLSIQMEHQQSMSTSLLKFFTYRTFSISFHLVSLVCVFIVLLQVDFLFLANRGTGWPIWHLYVISLCDLSFICTIPWTFLKIFRSPY